VVYNRPKAAGITRVKRINPSVVVPEDRINERQLRLSKPRKRGRHNGRPVTTINTKRDADPTKYRAHERILKSTVGTFPARLSLYAAFFAAFTFAQGALLLSLRVPICSGM
jgi:hypothetical protein